MTDHQSIPPLAPPQPMDPPATRPPLDLPNVINQVNHIQQFLADERKRKQEAEENWQKAKTLLEEKETRS